MHPRHNNRAARRAACWWPDGEWGASVWTASRTARQRHHVRRLRWQAGVRDYGRTRRIGNRLWPEDADRRVWRG